ncbi:MAG TPA: hypothetical protein VGI81_21035 [Tepidisphaeraceae bacterium]|jgi:hypothetical protein
MMTYSGTVKNGVVVLDSPTGLKDGARVRAEPEAEQASRPGDPAALLAADVKWVGELEEVDQLLVEVQQMRNQGVENTPPVG